MLELSQDFFKTFCASNKFEGLKIDTDSLYLATSGETLKTLFSQKKEMSGTDNVLKFAGKISWRTEQTVSSPELAAKRTQESRQESTGLLQRKVQMFRIVVLTAECVVAQIESAIISKSAAKESKKNFLEIVVMDQSQNIAELQKTLSR